MDNENPSRACLLGALKGVTQAAIRETDELAHSDQPPRYEARHTEMKFTPEEALDTALHRLLQNRRGNTTEVLAGND